MTKDPIGEKFGMWTVTAADRIEQRVRWVWCKCECGTTRSVRLGTLRNGASTNCGCVRHAKLGKRAYHRILSHGMSDTRAWRSWRSMRVRCRNPKEPGFAAWGGRGILVCDRWFDSFENFLEDMGVPPTPEHSLDRIDNDGHYEPGNCRWATRREQARNRRTAARFEMNGENLTIPEWCERLGKNRSTVKWRVYKRGMSISEALR